MPRILAAAIVTTLKHLGAAVYHVVEGLQLLWAAVLVEVFRRLNRHERRQKKTEAVVVETAKKVVRLEDFDNGNTDLDTVKSALEKAQELRERKPREQG